MATLVAVGLILAAPAYVQCAGATEGLAACLRSHIMGSGVLSGPDQPHDVAEVDIPPAPVGTLDAKAVEPAVPEPAGASLAPTPGTIAVANLVPGPPPASETVELTPPPGSVEAVIVPPPPASVPAAQLASSPAVAAPSDVEETGAVGILGQGPTPAISAAPVSLVATPGQLIAEVLPPQPLLPTSASLAPTDGNIGVSTTSASAPPSGVRIAPTPGSLHLTASEPVGDDTPYIATLAAPGGLVTLSQSAPPPPSPGVSVDVAAFDTVPLPTGSLSAAGVAFANSSDTTSVALIAEATPPPPGRLVAAAPAAPPPQAPTAVTVDAPPAPDTPVLPVQPPAPEVPTPPVPADPPPARILVEDPRYPSVILMPPPNTGENSSIITLQLGG